jgi:UDPglucose 6-dehydrogenase
MELRELWALDPRVSRSHTAVFADDRGFGGKCLPKDLNALIHLAHEVGITPSLLRGIVASNNARKHISVSS